MLAVGQEALCEWCGLDSRDCEGVRSVTRCVTWPLPRQPLWALILSVGKYAGLAALKKNQLHC